LNKENSFLEDYGTEVAKKEDKHKNESTQEPQEENYETRSEIN
jgi:hypothetical protein